MTTGIRGDTKTSYGHYAAWFATQLAAAGAGGAAPGSSSGAAASTINIDSRAPNGGGLLTDPMCIPFPG